MSLRTRIVLWWTAIFSVSLLVMGGVVYRELNEARHFSQMRQMGSDSVLQETFEFILDYGIPTALLLLVAGVWLLYRALSPVTRLTNAAEHLSLTNKQERLPLSGNGDELDRLTHVFNTMTERLQNSYSQMREFTLHASHELKTPLTIIHGELETALREETCNSRQRELYFSLLGEVQRLTKIVDSLSILSKADAGQITFQMEPIPLHDLVNDCMADAQVLGHSQQLTVILEQCVPINIRGDRHRLRQLFLNLVENAVKYNEFQGKITFSLIKDKDTALISISNTGPGLEPEKQPRVFERFFRGDPAHNSKTEGCGLGLAIAHWIVQMHNGTIEFDSRPGDWTTVRIRLPLLDANL